MIATDPHAPRSIERPNDDVVIVNTRACACHPGRREQRITLVGEGAQAYRERESKTARR